MRLEAGGFQQAFENAERAGIGRGDGRAANEIAGNGNGIIHVPRLTRHTGGGPALCGTISISLCWSQRGRVSMGASGSAPNRLVRFVPLKKPSSMKPQMQQANETYPTKMTG